MSRFLIKFLSPYLQNEAGDGTEGGAGGGAADRGDAIEDLPSSSEKEAAAKAADAQGNEDLKALEEEKAAAAAAAAEEAARDEKGRFTKKDDKEPSVPKHRFDEAVGKEREAREAAERRAAEAEAKLKQEAKNEDVAKMEEAVEKLEQQHAKLLLDGEADKAAAVMKQIRQSERAIARLETESTASAATERAVEQVRMESTIARLQADYPTFNPESESFDQDLVDIVLAEQQRLIQTQRMLPSAALATAAKKIMDKFAPKNDKVDDGDTKGLAAAKTADDRKAKQVAKNLDTDKRQAPSLKESGADSDKHGQTKTDVDVNKLTSEEFNALPESTKAKLRGDFAEA